MFHVTIYRQGTNHSKFLSQLVHEMVLLNTIRQGMNQSKFLSQHVYMRWFY